MGDVLQENTIREAEDKPAVKQDNTIPADNTVKLELDEGLVGELLQAAEYGQLTRLGELIKPFRQQEIFGDAGSLVAAHLEQLINSADLDGILVYVKSVVNE